MPIEVRELVIKAVVEEDATSGSSVSSNGDNSTTPNEGLINICVEKVLEILKEKMER